MDMDVLHEAKRLVNAIPYVRENADKLKLQLKKQKP